MMILTELASDDELDTAYEWLCRRRWDYSVNADVLSFRHHRSEEKNHIKRDLRADCYRLWLLSRVTLSGGDDVDLWPVWDALLMKMLTTVLARHLQLYHR